MSRCLVLLSSTLSAAFCEYIKTVFLLGRNTDLFYSERNKVDDWLMQLQVYFQFQPETKLPKEKWPLFATTYMRGNTY